MARYRAREGDTLDAVAFKYYGNHDNRTVERVLEANPRLAELGVIIPAGTLVELPDLPDESQSNGVRLWD